VPVKNQCPPQTCGPDTTLSVVDNNHVVATDPESGYEVGERASVHDVGGPHQIAEIAEVEEHRTGDVSFVERIPTGQLDKSETMIGLDDVARIHELDQRVSEPIRQPLGPRECLRMDELRGPARGLHPTPGGERATLGEREPRIL
jgi:hypothetical protein